MKQLLLGFTYGKHKESVTVVIFLNARVSLQLALYRHWTVECSLKYTMFTAVALKLWAIKGEKRLQKLLAEMGYVLNNHS